MRLATDSESAIPGRVALRLSWASPGGQGWGKSPPGGTASTRAGSQVLPRGAELLGSAEQAAGGLTDIPALGRRERVCEGGRAPAKLPAPAVPSGHSRVPWQWLCGALGPGVAALLKVTNQRKSVMIFFPVL